MAPGRPRLGGGPRGAGASLGFSPARADGAPMDRRRRFEFGIHCFLRREYDQAVGVLQEVVRDDPSDAAAWSFYGMTLAHLGRAAEAEAALSRAVALAPKNGEAWFHLGVARSLRDEWPEAASAYRQAVSLAPTDLVAWHRLGVALAESGDEAAATSAFERALVLSRELPASDGPHLPVSAHRLDDHTEEPGDREGGREAKSWLDLALSLLSLGDQEEAVAAYERAYTLDPERARRSLFRPMLRLVNAVEEDVLAPTPPAAEARPTPPRPSRPAPPAPDLRPEVG
jgi:tetratricopeptide (TPR) repeat protein